MRAGCGVLRLHEGVGALDHFGHACRRSPIWSIEIAGPVAGEARAADDHLREEALRIAAEEQDRRHRGRPVGRDAGRACPVARRAAGRPGARGGWRRGARGTRRCAPGPGRPASRRARGCPHRRRCRARAACAAVRGGSGAGSARRAGPGSARRRGRRPARLRRAAAPRRRFARRCAPARRAASRAGAG